MKGAFTRNENVIDRDCFR